MDVNAITVLEARDKQSKRNRARGLRPRTVQLYEQFWVVIDNWLRAQLDREPVVTDITPESMYEMFVDLYSDLDAGSWAVYRSRISMMGKFLQETGAIPYGRPAVDGIPVKIIDEKPPTSVSMADEKFLRVLECAKKRHIRDYYLFWWLRVAGRRLDEALRAKWGDVDWEANIVYFDDTKGRRKGVQMPLTRIRRLVLEAWRKEYEARCGCPVKDSWYIFPACKSSGGSRTSARRPRRLNPPAFHTNAGRDVRLIFKEAGVYVKWTGSHRMRKTVATRVKALADAQNRADSLNITQQVLAHKDPKTTQGYIDEKQEWDRMADFMMEFGDRIVSGTLIDATDFLSDLADPEAPPAPPPADESREWRKVSMATTEADDLLAEMDKVLAPRKAARSLVRR